MVTERPDGTDDHRSGYCIGLYSHVFHEEPPYAEQYVRRCGRSLNMKKEVPILSMVTSFIIVYAVLEAKTDENINYNLIVMTANEYGLAS